MEACKKPMTLHVFYVCVLSHMAGPLKTSLCGRDAVSHASWALYYKLRCCTTRLHSGLKLWHRTTRYPFCIKSYNFVLHSTTLYYLQVLLRIFNTGGADCRPTRVNSDQSLFLNGTFIKICISDQSNIIPTNLVFAWDIRPYACAAVSIYQFLTLPWSGQVDSLLHNM